LARGSRDRARSSSRALRLVAGALAAIVVSSTFVGAADARRVRPGKSCPRAKAYLYLRDCRIIPGVSIGGVRLGMSSKQVRKLIGSGRPLVKEGDVVTFLYARRGLVISYVPGGGSLQVSAVSISLASSSLQVQTLYRTANRIKLLSLSGPVRTAFPQAVCQTSDVGGPEPALVSCTLAGSGQPAGPGSTTFVFEYDPSTGVGPEQSKQTVNEIKIAAG